MTPSSTLRCLCLSLACLAATARASHHEEIPYLEELPVVLSATRLPQSLPDAPGAITVIDRSLIAATGYRDLARVLRLVPGMQVGQERGHAQWVTYHGLSNDFPTEMQVLIDGRSVISPSAFGGVDWSALPLTVDEIERIEVVRGTNASGFGANAFLGVINIITRHSADLPGTSASVRAGNRGVRDADAAWSGGTGALSLRLNAATHRDEGFSGLSDARRMDVLTLRGDLQLSADDSVLLRIAGSRGRRGEGYPDSVFGNNALRDAHNDNEAFHLQWRHSASADGEWVLSYYRNHERIRDEWAASAPQAGFPSVPLDRNRHSVRDNLELQHRSAPSPALQLVWGAEARQDRIDAPFLFYSGNPPTQRLYRLFGNAEWRPYAALTVNLGAAYERYSDTSPHLSPRLFANWQARPDHTLRAGYARAYRQRNAFELYGDIRAIGVLDDPAHPLDGQPMLLVRPFAPNAGLRQTRVDAVELGYLGRLPRAGATLDVRLFNERIHDFIVRAPHEDTAPLLSAQLGSTRYENLGHAITLRGIETQFVTRPRPGTEVRFAHSMIDRHAGSRGIENRVAPYTAALSWLQDWGAGWHSMITVLRMGPLSGGDGFVPSKPYVARPYTTADAHLAYRTRIGTRPLRLSLTAVNLGPRHQEFANRTQQAIHGDKAHNPVSRGLYFSLALPID